MSSLALLSQLSDPSFNQDNVLFVSSKRGQLSPHVEAHSDSQRKQKTPQNFAEKPEKNFFAKKIEKLNQLDPGIKKEALQPKNKPKKRRKATVKSENKIHSRKNHEKSKTEKSENGVNRKNRKTRKRSQKKTRFVADKLSNSEQAKSNTERGLMHQSFLKYSQNTSRLGVRRSYRAQRANSRQDAPSQKIQCKEEFDEELNHIKIEEISVNFRQASNLNPKKPNVMQMYERASEGLRIQRVFESVEQISRLVLASELNRVPKSSN